MKKLQSNQNKNRVGTVYFSDVLVKLSNIILNYLIDRSKLAVLYQTTNKLSNPYNW